MAPKRGAAKKVEAPEAVPAEAQQPEAEAPAEAAEAPAAAPKRRKRAAAAPPADKAAPAAKKAAGKAAAKAEEAAAEAPPAAAKAKAGKLSPGDALPAFELETDEGTQVKSSDLVAEGGIIIFSYPKANTPGCTKQACGFRDNFEALQAAGFKPYGISADKPKSQSNWRTKHGFQYNLLCDPERKTLKALGFGQGDKIVRSHIVVAKGGDVIDVQYGISPGDSFTMALEAAQAHK